MKANRKGDKPCVSNNGSPLVLWQQRSLIMRHFIQPICFHPLRTLDQMGSNRWIKFAQLVRQCWQRKKQLQLWWVCWSPWWVKIRIYELGDIWLPLEIPWTLFCRVCSSLCGRWETLWPWVKMTCSSGWPINWHKNDWNWMLGCHGWAHEQLMLTFDDMSCGCSPASVKNPLSNCIISIWMQGPLSPQYYWKLYIRMVFTLFDQSP